MYLFHSNNPLLSYFNPYANQIGWVTSMIRSWLLPLIDQVTRKPDLATIALLLIIVLVSLKILDMLWQTVKFWLRLARRIVLFAGLAALALWLWSRGPDGVMDDIGYWVRMWNTEHQYWLDKERAAKMARQKPAYGRQGAGWF